MITIAAHSKIRRKSTYLETELDDETIIMQSETGLINSMADTGREIWARLSDEPVSFADLIDYLVGEFDVERDTCVAEVSRFLAELEKQDFIETTIE